MKLNEKKLVKIISDNHNGVGMAKESSVPIFVPGTLSGDVVRVRIVKISKKYAFGEVLSYIEKSDKYEEVVCPCYENCGGCASLHISYERENDLKREYVQKLFKNVPVKIIYFKRFNYRNKVTLHIKDNKLGFYSSNSNDLIPLWGCLLLDEDINDLIRVIEKFDLSLISEIVIKKGKSGLLLLAEGFIANDDVVTLMKYKKLKSIYQNDILVYGEPYIDMEIGDFKYLVNGRSFFQVNKECTKALYDKVKEYVFKSDRLLDLYCGTGSIGIYLHDICKEIVGVEINKDSVKCAKMNIKNNGINNYKVILGDASVVKDNFDTIVVDPPRSGLSKEVINNIKFMKSERIIYVSCNPSTLRRDVDLLCDYELKNLEVFNMFPGTKHVESVAVLHRKVVEE